MRIEKLIEILEETKRQKKAVVCKPIDISQIKRICYMGICDQEIVDYIIPQLVHWEIHGGFSKENLEKFITECQGIHLLPDPVRHETDKTDAQRRIDSLARLISIDVKYTACVAVACYDGQLIVSANESKIETEEFIEACFAKKIDIIRGFLAKLANDIPAERSRSDIIKIEFSTLARMYAYRASHDLIKEDNGGVGQILPSKLHRRHGRIEKHLENALLKLGKSYLLSLYTNGQQGLSISEAQALSSAPFRMVSAKRCGLELGTQELHAEQAIAQYLRQHPDFKTKEPLSKVNIGISKLCCNACYDVFKKDALRFSVRGNHGMTYRNVHDIDTGTVSTCPETKLCKEASPSDSESDCDFYSDHEAEKAADIGEMRVPSFQKLLSTSPTESSLPSRSKKQEHSPRLFGACRDASRESTAPHALHRVITA